MKQLTSKE